MTAVLLRRKNRAALDSGITSVLYIQQILNIKFNKYKCFNIYLFVKGVCGVCMNSIQKRTEQRDSAVSPVVGVMLMLVVTIIIAAVVAAFAGGLVTNTEKAPTAVLDVKILSAANVGGTMSHTYAPDFTIDHLSGDPISTSDIRLEFRWSNSTGYNFLTTYDGPGLTNFKINFPYYSGGNASLYLNDQAAGSPGYGNATLTTGSHMQTGGNNLYQNFAGGLTTHIGSVFMDDLFGRDIDTEFTPMAADAGSEGPTTEKRCDGIIA